MDVVPQSFSQRVRIHALVHGHPVVGQVAHDLEQKIISILNKRRCSDSPEFKNISAGCRGNCIQPKVVDFIIQNTVEPFPYAKNVALSERKKD